MKTRIIGAGHYVPDRAIGNDRITKAIPGWPGDKIAQKTGIVERRFLWDFDDEAGKAIVPPEGAFPRSSTDMCEIALRNAVAASGIDPAEIDGILLCTCTPDEINFCHDAMMLHQRLGLRPEALAIHVDSGCGGALYLMALARKLIEGGSCRTVAVVAANITSPYVDREVFTSALTLAPGGKPLGACLTMYLFGDGAGAVLLRAEDAGDAGFLSSYAGCAYSELVVRRGGGASFPPMAPRSTAAHHAYVVDGPLVAQCFPGYMQQCVDHALAGAGKTSADIDRFYLHQANRRLVEAFAAAAGFPADKVAMHMHRYGNMSAAGTLVLLSEDLAEGKVAIGGGQLALFAAIGAGVHYAGHVVRL